MTVVMKVSKTVLLVSFLFVLLFAEVSAGCDASSPNARADIVFLIDSSSSVGLDNFKKQLKFISNLAGALPIGPEGIHFGIETFSANIHHQFDLREHHTKSDLIHAIESVPYKTRGTATGKALFWVMKNSFKRQRGSRNNVPHILIVTTDGHSDDQRETLRAAHELRTKNITSICIGIGKHVDRREISAIASSPDNAVFVHTFIELLSRVLNITLEKIQRESACGRIQITSTSKQISSRTPIHQHHISTKGNQIMTRHGPTRKVVETSSGATVQVTTYGRHEQSTQSTSISTIAHKTPSTGDRHKTVTSQRATVSKESLQTTLGFTSITLARNVLVASTKFKTATAPAQNTDGSMTTNAVQELEFRPYLFDVEEFKIAEVCILSLTSLVLLGLSLCCCRRMFFLCKQKDDDDDDEDDAETNGVYTMFPKMPMTGRICPGDPGKTR